jgi:hypothetical protein
MAAEWSARRRRGAVVGIAVGGFIGLALAYRGGDTFPALLYIPVGAIVGFASGALAGSYWGRQPNKTQATIWTIVVSVIAFALFFVVSRYMQRP